jgi:hypothetical protein
MDCLGPASEYLAAVRAGVRTTLGERNMSRQAKRNTAVATAGAREPDDLARQFRGWFDPLIGVELTRQGISALIWDERKREYSRGLLDLTKPMRLAATWRASVGVAEGYRMGDLFALLRAMSPDVLDLLEKLTNASVKPFFADLDVKPPARRKRGPWALAAIEVSRSIEIDHHDGKREARRITDHVGAAGVLRRAHVSPSGHRDRVVALELTPWREMVTLPLLIGKTGSLNQRFWKRCKPRSIVVNRPSGSSFFPRAKGREASRRRSRARHGAFGTHRPLVDLRGRLEGGRDRTYHHRRRVAALERLERTNR